MVQLRNVYSHVLRCHTYKKVEVGNYCLPKAWKCCDILTEIEHYRMRKISSHKKLPPDDLVKSIAKDLVAMGLIKVIGQGSIK